MSAAHSIPVESDFDRGRRQGRREVIEFLRRYAGSLVSQENRGGLLASMTRKIGIDATEGLAKLIERHFEGQI